MPLVVVNQLQREVDETIAKSSKTEPSVTKQYSLPDASKPSEHRLFAETGNRLL